MLEGDASECGIPDSGIAAAVAAFSRASSLLQVSYQTQVLSRFQTSYRESVYNPSPVSHTGLVEATLVALHLAREGGISGTEKAAA